MVKEKARQYQADVAVVVDESSDRIYIRACNAGPDVWLNFHVAVSDFDDSQIQPPRCHEPFAFKQDMQLDRQGPNANTSARTNEMDFITEKLREIYGENAEVSVTRI